MLNRGLPVIGSRAHSVRMVFSGAPLDPNHSGPGQKPDGPHTSILSVMGAGWYSSIASRILLTASYCTFLTASTACTDPELTSALHPTSAYLPPLIPVHSLLSLSTPISPLPFPFSLSAFHYVLPFDCMGTSVC